MLCIKTILHITKKNIKPDEHQYEKRHKTT